MTTSGDFDLILTTTHYQVTPGVPITIPLTLVNKGVFEDRVQIAVDGVPAEWVAISHPLTQVQAGDRQEIQIRIKPPRSVHIKTGLYSLSFRATSLITPDLKREIQASLLVGTVLFQGNLGLLISTTQFCIEPGRQVDIPVFLVNSGLTESRIRLTLEGISTEWISVSDEEVWLAAGERRRLLLQLHPPRAAECRAGRHTFNFNLISKSDPGTLLRLPCLLNVAAYTAFQGYLEPDEINNNQQGRVVIKNRGNIPQTYSLEWQSADGTIIFSPSEKQSLRILPGDMGEVSFTGRTRQRSWFGTRVAHPYKVNIKTAEGETSWIEGTLFSGERFPWRVPGRWVDIAHSIRHWWGRVNWPLVAGGMIVLILFLLAIVGPNLAPQNPMQENFTLSINGQITRPPYPPFTIPGYTLGTDEFGRDLLSRILWGIRPTVYLVLAVAVIRLILGYMLGLWIGWSKGMGGKVLDEILSIALAIPVLIVALMGITAVGIQKGFPAVIFGLALTGWAETARIISTQTRIIKYQRYIEAAKALGGSDLRLIINHIWRQLRPLLGMLMAFEISSTLFVVAELGFLGYFIGGGIWIEISDFKAINAIGLPELGQLLSTALVTLVKPMPLLVIGSVIFFAILGFNLLGEGLRLRLSRPVAFKSRRWWRISERIRNHYEASYGLSLADWIERNAIPVGVTCVAALIIGGWSMWWVSRPAKVKIDDQRTITVPGGHFWATELHDASGTQWTPFNGPQNSQVYWKYQGTEGFASGPVVDAEENVYISDLDQHLIVFNSIGVEQWNVELPFIPVGSPAIGSRGDLYATGDDGSLAAFTLAGLPLWIFTPQVKREATSGPIVDSSGNIYYTSVDHIQAVSPDGKSLWRKPASDVYIEEPPILSAGESYLFLKSVALAAKNGTPLDMEGIPIDELKFTSPEFFVGANQKTYFRTGHEVYGWQFTETGLEVDDAITWDYNGNVVIFPQEQGATPEGFIWMFYSGDYFDTNFVWLDKEGKQLSNIRLPDRQSDMIAVDRNLVMYICSNNLTLRVNCGAWKFGETNPIWTLEIGDYINIVGGALAPDRMYVATNDGQLIAIGAGQP